MKTCAVRATRGKIAIQAKSTSQSSLGEVLDTWTTVAEPWAEIVHKPGDENYQSGQEYARGKTEFKIRYAQTITITAQSRIVFDGEEYDILDWAKDPPVRARQLIIIAEARRD